MTHQSAASWKELPGRAPEEQIFAIGDIHGQAETLRKTLARIASTERCAKTSHLVFTGDIIDRGPDNLGAVDMVLNAKELAGVDKVTLLPGNHELMLMAAIEKRGYDMQLWAVNGGYPVIEEVDPYGHMQSEDDVARGLAEAMAPFIKLLKAAPNHLRIADLLFVHAGISPHEDMTTFLAQSRAGDPRQDEHWAWIREPFLTHQGGWNGEEGLVVVHGHTPANHRLKLDPAMAADYLDRAQTHRRICVDAGAAGLDQAALLEVRDGQYRIETICEKDFNPNLDDHPFASMEVEP
jgi:serine/threonine protein phosphatase 1